MHAPRLALQRPSVSVPSHWRLLRCGGIFARHEAKRNVASSSQRAPDAARLPPAPEGMVKPLPLPRAALDDRPQLVAARNMRASTSTRHFSASLHAPLEPAPSLRPKWLPFPAHPSTHKRKHLRVEAALAAAAEASGATGGAVSAAPSPIADRPFEAAPSQELRYVVFVGKKKVAKSAVVRNRVRTRVVAALRAVLQMRAAQADTLDEARSVASSGVERVHAALQGLCLPGHCYAFHPNISVLEADFSQLLVSMRTALERLAATAQRGESSSSSSSSQSPKRRKNVPSPRSAQRKPGAQTSARSASPRQRGESGPRK